MRVFVRRAAHRVTEGEAVEDVLDLDEPLVAEVYFLVNDLLRTTFVELREVEERLAKLCDLRGDKVVDFWVAPSLDNVSQNFVVEVFTDCLQPDQV